MIDDNSVTERSWNKTITIPRDGKVTTRPPQPELYYRGFIKPGPQTLTMAIGHREGDERIEFIVDLYQHGLTAEQTIELVKAYGLDTVTFAKSDSDNAFGGVFRLLLQDDIAEEQA